jgi:hypothetical protein
MHADTASTPLSDGVSRELAALAAFIRSRAAADAER